MATPTNTSDLQKLMDAKAEMDREEAKAVRYGKELVAAERRVRNQQVNAEKAKANYEALFASFQQAASGGGKK